MLRQEKEAFVTDIREDLLNSGIVIVVNRGSGITVEEVTKLRKDLNKSKSKFKIIKNTLARKAMEKSDLDCLSQYLSGMTGFAYSNDPVEASKAVFTFCKDSEGKMEILAGFVDGKCVTSSEIKELATLPSLDGLRSQIVGLLSAVAGKLVRTINEPGAMIARIIAKKAEN